MTFTLENYLSSLHQGQWFGFDGDKTYANVIVHDDSKTLPTEQECIDGVQALQDEYDNANLEYKVNRMNEYPYIGDQLDDLFKAGAFSTEMTATLQAVKDKYPKE